jgi:hypothetical protein
MILVHNDRHEYVIIAFAVVVVVVVVVVFDPKNLARL